MRTILVSKIAAMALTESDGLKLRKAMEASLENDKEIELDFSGISLFATMFFNASIGNLIMRFSPEKCAEIIRLTHISDLGMDTYQHSFENARFIFVQRDSLHRINTITECNLSDS